MDAQVEHKVVAIVTPMQDMCHGAFASALVNLVAHTMSQDHAHLTVTFLHCGTSILPLSRQFLAVRSLEIEATHVLWIDSDMEFPPDLLLRMALHDKPIVAANCMSRRPPYMLTARGEDGKEVYTTEHSSGIEKVDRIGFGCVWMSTDIFRQVPIPWFDLKWLPEMGIFQGEDYGFCEKVKAAGFPLYVDHDVSKDIKHIGTFGYSPLHKQCEGDSA